MREMYAPESNLEILLWRFLRGLDETEDVFKFTHAFGWKYYSLKLIPCSLFELHGKFEDQSFAAVLEIDEDREAKWSVSNPTTIIRWLAFERLRSPNLLPDIHKKGTSHYPHEECTFDLSCSGYGIPTQDERVARFLNWAEIELTDDFINYTLDVSCNDSPVELTCSFFLANVECSTMISKRRNLLASGRATKELLFTTPEIVLAINMLILSELKRYGNISLFGGDIDDADLVTRRKSSLTDVSIMDNQKTLIDFLKSEIGDRLPVFSELLDWSPVDNKSFFKTASKNRQLPDIKHFSSNLFPPELLTKTGFMAA